MCVNCTKIQSFQEIAQRERITAVVPFFAEIGLQTLTTDYYNRDMESLLLFTSMHAASFLQVT
jgi:hypothetical protein